MQRDDKAAGHNILGTDGSDNTQITSQRCTDTSNQSLTTVLYLEFHSAAVAPKGGPGDLHVGIQRSDYFDQQNLIRGRSQV